MLLLHHKRRFVLHPCLNSKSNLPVVKNISVFNYEVSRCVRSGNKIFFLTLQSVLCSNVYYFCHSLFLPIYFYQPHLVYDGFDYLYIFIRREWRWILKIPFSCSPYLLQSYYNDIKTKNFSGLIIFCRKIASLEDMYVFCCHQKK